MGRLSTPRIHRLLRSPVGRIFDTGLFRRLKLRGIPTEFAVVRARAVADRSETVAEFCEGLGIQEPTGRKRRRLEAKLREQAERQSEATEILSEWDDCFWGDEPPAMEERVELEQARRETSEAWLKPNRSFALLVRGGVDPVEFDIPPPDRVMDEWENAIATPEELYGPPDGVEIQSSHTVAGPGTREYLIRFPSPSPHVGDTAFARVYEPVRGQEDSVESEQELPTLIFGSGLGTMNDSLVYWPEEEYIGRRLAPAGIRVVLPEPPWSGRRELPGSYSGEPYLARAPVGTFQLYAAQVQETALLTDWARSKGSEAVAVGGMSLGGIVTAFVIAHSGSWPDRMRPDMAFPIAFSTEIDRLLQQSTITDLLGVTDALAESGWTPDRLHALAPLLRATGGPGIPADQIYPFAGTEDDAALFELAEATLDEWGVPPENRTIWPTDHFGVYFKALRENRIQERLLHEIQSTTQKEVP
jgi:hypothetical protein